MKRIAKVVASTGVMLLGLAARADVVDGVLTLDGEVRSIAAESELGEDVTAVVMRNSGGIAVTEGFEAQKTYSIAGDGLAATGVVSVAAGKQLTFTGPRLAVGAVGHTLVKRGAGTLLSGSVSKAAAAPTRFIVEEGRFQCSNGDFWGGHTTANTNCVIDVREGAVYDHGSSHGVVGPIELTGAQFLSRNGAPYNNQWADASLDGGVTAHACETASYMFFRSWGFLGHNKHTNCVFNVESGARLIVDGVLKDGYDNAGCGNRLIKRGAGELVLLRNGGWTGGTVLEGGTVVVTAPEALAGGAVTVAGDVTLRVPAGITFVCPPVTGAGTITKTGAGVASFPTVGAGVTVTEAEPGTIGEALKDGVICLSGGTTVVEVPAEERVVVTAIEEAEPGVGSLTDIIKTGAGALVLPEGSECKYRRLITRGGFVEVLAESCFGSDGVTLEQGGGLRVAASFDQKRSRITCAGATRLDIPDGVTLGVHSNYFVSTGATVTKTGAGTWRLTSPFRKDKLSWINFTGTRWIVDEGRLRLCDGDAFCGAGGTCPLVIEVHEAGELALAGGYQHTPVCDIVLRGGTMRASLAQFRTDGPLEAGANWKGFGLEGRITVLPSEQPARLIAHQCHLAHNAGRTTFDVREGATLEVDAMLQPGMWSKQPGFTKCGGGTLRLLKPVGARGTVEVEEGVLELGPNVKLNDHVSLAVSPRAKLVLGDGVQLATRVDLFSKLCASAEVWFDAAALDLADGAAVSSVPNRGTAGGAFTVVKGLNSYTPTAPTYVRDGINGRGTVFFNGAQALVSAAYTNRGARATVFLVSKWTSWAAEGGKGKWGGPISLSSVKPAHTNNQTGDDNQCYGSLSFQHGSSSAVDAVMATYGGDGVAPDLRGLPALGVPYITTSCRDRDASVFFTEVAWADGLVASTNKSGLGACDMDVVCIGGRTRKGVPQIHGAVNENNRMYIGQIGEVLVFSRALTEAETATITAYLKAKWLGVGEPSRDEAKDAAATLRVEVPHGTAAVVAGATAGAAVEKTGAGALSLGGTPVAFVDVQEGTLDLRTGTLPPQVDIWIDASDASGMTFDAAGRVTNLVNRGACGGAFVRNARAAQVPEGAQWFDDAAAEHSINGRPALVFDGDSALALISSYTNTTTPRRISIYCIAERTSWELNPGASDGGGRGKWAGPFALGDTTAQRSDEAMPGIVSIEESAERSGSVDTGSRYLSFNNLPATGEAYLLVLHSTSNGCFIAHETAVMDSQDIKRTVANNWDNEPLQIDIVQLATRTAVNGGPQWWGKGNAANRCWYGKIGEFIVTTDPLDETQETELFAYLRRKWLNKGDGSETPPAWLTGLPTTPALDAGTDLALADGAALRHAAPPVELGRLETTGTVNWTRVWDKAASAEAATLFNVAGDVALGAVVLDIQPVPTEAKLVGFTGAELTTATWTVTGGGSASVMRRSNGYWIGRSGSVIYIR